MSAESTIGLNPRLDSLRRLPIDAFSLRYSLPEPTLELTMADVYASTTEVAYADSLPALTVRGGIHLAVAGGLDPALGQIAVVNPDISILCDVNPFVSDMVAERLKILDVVENGKNYWKKFRSVHRQSPSLSQSMGIEKPEQDLVKGWSSDDHFVNVKHSWQNGKIKLITGSILTQGLQVALDIAEETETPISLLYLSNIMDWFQNFTKLRKLQEILSESVSLGLMSPDAQIVYSTIFDNMKNRVVSVAEFVDLKRFFNN